MLIVPLKIVLNVKFLMFVQNAIPISLLILKTTIPVSITVELIFVLIALIVLATFASAPLYYLEIQCAFLDAWLKIARPAQLKSLEPALLA